MKLFLQRLIFFICPILIFGYAGDDLLTKSLRKSRQYQFAVWNDIFSGNINSELVIYGSSRAWVHFDPKIIADSLHMNAYNLGIDGHNFWLQYLRHSLLLEYNKKPKIIIHSLDYSTLQKIPDLYNLEQFLPYMVDNRKIIDATQSYNGFNFFDYKVPFIRYVGENEVIKNALKVFFLPSKNIEELQRGYLPQEQTWNDDLMKAQKKMKQYEIKIDTPSVRLFDEYLKECSVKNIDVIFVYSPEYIDGQRFVKNRKEIFSIFSTFSNKYHIPFFDFSHDSLSYHREYFYNSAHLNKNGAELFTKKLMHELKHNGLTKDGQLKKYSKHHVGVSSQTD